MADELLISRTKIILPQRRKELLSRPRLLELLSDLLDFRLIIIAAPAGYGKTSLLIDFAHQFDWPVCWLALDPLDNDLHRFLSHFVMSIKQQFPEFGEEALNILKTTPADQINQEYLVSALTNDIYEKVTEHFIVVLDDYHLLNSSGQIDKFLSEFIQRADDNCHIAITSRKLLTLPDLPLMVARAQVGGLSIEELVFQPDEIQKLYCQVFHKEIDSKEASDIAAASEGWITGLLLTSPMLRSGLGEPIKIARASGIGLYEYLAQQVLTQQPENVQAFLLNSSILEEFNAEMCREVIGKALNQTKDWNRLMESIFHNNLFVLPVDDEYKWLRYHHLFRDFLRSTLESQRPEDAEKIKLQLAEYFYTREDWEKVFDIYLHLGNIQSIAALIKRVGTVFIARGKIAKLSEWLTLLPAEMISLDPVLLSIQATVTFNQGRIQEGKDLLDKVIEMLGNDENNKGFADNLIRRSSALRILGNYESALADAEKAIQLSSGKKELEPIYSEALRAKGTVLYQTGYLKEGLEVLNQAVKISERVKNEEDIARVLVEIGAIYERLGQFPAAERAYEKSLAFWQSAGDSIWISTILNNLGVLQHSSGEFIKSFLNLEKSMHYSRLTGNQRMEGYALASIGDLYKDLDALEEASEAYQKALEIAQQIEDQYLIFYLKTSSARLAVAQQQLSKADLQIRTANTLAKKSGSAFDAHKVMLEQSSLEFAGKKYQSIIENLEIAYKFFSKEGHIEDSVRAQALLFSTLANLGDKVKALVLVKDFSAGISDPARYIPSLVMINELQELFKSLVLKNEIGTEVSNLLSHLNDFQKLTQKSRRLIRKAASVVPFAPAKIEIRAFGRTEVVVKNHTLSISDWKTQMSRDLFFLFLAHPEGLTKEEVGEIMWQDLSPAELKLRFKNAIYRMRHAIGSEAVHFQDNYYQFNRSIDYDYDVQNFLNASNIAREERNPEKQINAYKTAIGFYQGPYLADMDYFWVIPDRQKFHELAVSNLLDLAQLLFKNQKLEEGLIYCHQALREDPCNENIHRLSMEIYSAMGNKSAVSRQYQQCMKILKDEVSALPSEATVSLYNSLMEQ
jgi:ATP/maltotriose-dependent transcriptional regulator MalT/two-component SAPR family response regulator